MPSIPKEKLNRLVTRWETLQTQLSSGSDQETFIKLSKEFAELDPLVASTKSLRDAEHQRQGRVRAHEIRIGCSSRAARTGNRESRANPHFSRNGRGVAGSGGHRH